MKGFITLTAIGEEKVAEARRTLLPGRDGKGHAAGVSIRAELEDVSTADRLTLMSALGQALHFDNEDWFVLFAMKAGIGPFHEDQVNIAVPADLNDNAGGRI